MSDFTHEKYSLPVDVWNPSDIVFKPFKKNDRGGGSVSILTNQLTVKMLRINTPLMYTWGISDYVDDKTGESDGRFTMTLNFPNEDYATADTNALLEKFKEFENVVLDMAVENSEKWFGKKLSRELCEDRFFSSIKYRKNKDTGSFDYDKPPSLRIRVPCYDGKWGITLFDSDKNLIFPSEDPDNQKTPPDLVEKQSNIACAIQCGGIWFGGKGWGVTWRLNQAVVHRKKKYDFNNDVCIIDLSNDDKQRLENPLQSEVQSSEVIEEAPQVDDTKVEDSDEDKEEPTPPPAPKKVVKKIVKKKVAPSE